MSMMCNYFDPITFSTAPTCYVCSNHNQCEKEKAAASAANTDNGKVEKGLLTSFSTADNNRNIRRFQA